VRLGDPPGVRQIATAAAWYDSLTGDDKTRIVTTHKNALQAMKISGSWKVSGSNSPQANLFLSGFGELFSERRIKNRIQIVPNYMYFLVEMLHVWLKVLIIVLVRDASVQCGLIVALDTLEFIIFAIQQPYSDRWLSLDRMISKPVSIISFAVLSNADSDQAASFLMVLNMSMLYWMISMQLLRKSGLVWNFIWATLACIVLGCAMFPLLVQGKLTPAKMRNKETRQEVMVALKPHMIRMFKAGMALKRSVGSVNADGGTVTQSNTRSLATQNKHNVSTFGMLRKMNEDLGLAALKEEMKAKLEPIVVERGLPWKVIEAQIDLIDSADELQNAIEDPEEYLQKATFALGRDIVLAKVMDMLKPVCERRKIPWEPVKKLVSDIESLEDLQEIAADPGMLLKKVSSLGLEVAMAKACEVLQPLVAKRGIPWAPVSKLLDEVDSLGELESIASDPDAFLKKVSSIGLEVAMPNAL